jgi:hypothetical protein
MAKGGIGVMEHMETSRIKKHVVTHKIACARESGDRSCFSIGPTSRRMRSSAAGVGAMSRPVVLASHLAISAPTSSYVGHQIRQGIERDAVTVVRIRDWAGFNRTLRGDEYNAALKRSWIWQQACRTS